MRVLVLLVAVALAGIATADLSLPRELFPWRSGKGLGRGNNGGIGCAVCTVSLAIAKQVGEMRKWGLHFSESQYSIAK
jgi:hypothetical protein